MTTLTANPAPFRWWQSRVVRRFMSHRLALLGLVMISALTLLCIIGPWLLPYDSLYIDLRARFAVYGKTEAFEGPTPDGLLILEFPSADDARAWYDSPEYQAAVAQRKLGADYRAILIEGLPSA